MIINLLFIFFALSLIVNASLVVLTPNSVYSAFFLILSFISATCILFLLECDYIAIIFITIYVGAIAILFLFVVMMLTVKNDKVFERSVKTFPFGFVFGSLFFAEIVYVLNDSFVSNPYLKNGQFVNYYVNWFEKIDAISEIEALGQIIYSHYAVQFLAAGSILLLAAVGAVVLIGTYKKKKFGNRQLLSRFHE